jgi:hypothetical protein
MDVLWSLIQDEGAPEVLGSALNPAGPLADWVIILLAADPPQRTDLTLADLVEPTNDGYSRKRLLRNGWVVGTPAGGCTVATMPGLDVVWFADSGSTQIFGAAYYNPQSGKLIAVFRFKDAKIVTWNAGSALTIAPGFTLTSAMC